VSNLQFLTPSSNTLKSRSAETAMSNPFRLTASAQSFLTKSRVKPIMFSAHFRGLSLSGRKRQLPVMSASLVMVLEKTQGRPAH